MADENVQATEVVAAPAQQDHAAELAQMMNMSLGMGSTQETQVVNEPVTETQTQVTAEAVKPEVQTIQAADPFGFLKEKFGYENHDAAIKEIEELRAFRANPGTPQFQVPDDESAAILKALAAGKKEDVWRLLDHDMRIDRLVNGEVNKDSATEIVKMGMQLKYKDLTPDEINYKFNKQFAIPPQPQKGYDEDDDVFIQRVSEWEAVKMDKQMELMIEAKMIKPELQNAKQKFTLPEIETPVDEGYAQYQQMLAQKAQDDVATREAYKSLTPKAVETKISFKDEANKIDFEFQYEPEAQNFAKAQEIACDADKFWQTFINPDGSPNRQLFLESILYAIDKKSIILSAINQAKNATIKASLPDNSKGGLLTHQLAQSQEPNELDLQMRASLRGHGGF